MTCGDTEWTTRGGDKLLIHDMGDDHLINAIHQARRLEGEYDRSCWDFDGPEYVECPDCVALLPELEQVAFARCLDLEEEYEWA